MTIHTHYGRIDHKFYHTTASWNRKIRRLDIQRELDVWEQFADPIDDIEDIDEIDENETGVHELIEIFFCFFRGLKIVCSVREGIAIRSQPCSLKR